MISFDDVTKENVKKSNPNWLLVPDQPYRILITGGSVSWKRNSLFHLNRNQGGIFGGLFCGREEDSVEITSI